MIGSDVLFASYVFLIRMKTNHSIIQYEYLHMVSFIAILIYHLEHNTSLPIIFTLFFLAITDLELSLLTLDPAPYNIVSLKLSTDSAANTLGFLLPIICTLKLLAPDSFNSRDVRLTFALDELNGIKSFASLSLGPLSSAKTFFEFFAGSLTSSDNASLAFSRRFFNFSSFFSRFSVLVFSSFRSCRLF